MKKTTTAARSNPVANDPEVVAFRAQFDERSPLDEIVRSGAEQMLQAAIDAEVADFLAEHAGRRDESGNRLVVRNGYGDRDRLRYEALLGEYIHEYFQREIEPHVPDAWIDEDKTKIGYEIPFNRHL